MRSDEGLVGAASIGAKIVHFPRLESALPTQSLIVRLPNHLGDACMSLPALDLLAESGIALTLAGRPWSRELFGAYPHTVVALCGTRGARLGALRALRRPRAAAVDALLLTNSFSSALEFRLAGLRPCGYATDGRSLLLGRALALPKEEWRSGMHMVEYYLHLARSVLASDPTPEPTTPRDPHLRLEEAAYERARAALGRAGAAPPYVVLCPVAQGRHHGQDKCWSGFGRLAQELVNAGRHVVACPGPGERVAAAEAAPAAKFVEALDLAAFGALLAQSALVVANDSGPGHLAAAVGANLISVFGVTSPARTRPRSARALLLGAEGSWPSYAQVANAVEMTLSGNLAQSG